MPIYEYHCTHCDHHSEILQGIHDAALVHCEECQQDTLKRLVSASGFRLKGGGWYETDFKTATDKQKNLVNTTTESTSNPVSVAPVETKSSVKADDKATKTTESKKASDKASTTD